MRNYALPSFFFLLVLAVAITLACGSPTGPSNTTGILKSISINPPTADAEKYPDGQVQFIATGYYTTPPFQVTPLKAQGWGVCQQNNPTTAVSISSTGLAQCTAGASGEYSVFASAFPYQGEGEANCLLLFPCGGGCVVSGYAQLTCL
jgi:hypothetical protein